MNELGPQDVLIATFHSLGAAYQAAQTVPEGARIMEIFPLGSKGHVIFQSGKSLRGFCEETKSKFTKDLLQITHVPACSAKVLRAYLSVENAALAESLLILESPQIGPLMLIAHQSVQQGLALVDLRMLRGSSSSSYLFVTGAKGDLAAFAGTLEVADVKATLLEQPHPQVRGFFEIEPHSP